MEMRDLLALLEKMVNKDHLATVEMLAQWVDQEREVKEDRSGAQEKRDLKVVLDNLEMQEALVYQDCLENVVPVAQLDHRAKLDQKE